MVEVMFCLGRLQRGACGQMPHFTPLTRFPKWWWLSNIKDSLTKPSEWKAPRHLFYLPRWMEGCPLGGRDQQKSPRYSYWVLCMLVLPSSDRSYLSFTHSRNFTHKAETIKCGRCREDAVTLEPNPHKHRRGYDDSCGVLCVY